jgi:translocator protein
MSEIASRGQLRMTFVRWVLVTVPSIILLGFLSAAVSGSGATGGWYLALDKPALQPPGIAFPIAWTILYALMGVALAMIIVARGARGRSLAIGLFAAQLAANLTWSPVFFGLHQVSWALVVIALMFGLTVGTIGAFWKVRPRAAQLLLPYLAWIAFAGYLNWEIRILNPDAEALVPGRQGTQFDLD